MRNKYTFITWKDYLSSGNKVFISCDLIAKSFLFFIYIKISHEIKLSPCLKLKLKENKLSVAQLGKFIIKKIHETDEKVFPEQHLENFWEKLFQTLAKFSTVNFIVTKIQKILKFMDK